MIFKAIKFITSCLFLSLIFFAKVYAEDTVGFITDIKGKVKKINEKKEEIKLNIYDQITIDQLITVEASYKLLSEYERRALLYQGILISNSPEKKIELIK